MKRHFHSFGETANAAVALEHLGALILDSLSGEKLERETVAAACDALSQKLSGEEYLQMLVSSGLSRIQAAEELAFAKNMFSRSYLEERLKHELGGLED
ncbi:MAG TPA: hypothetical protein PLR57_04845, partial [Clostridia bacterium]|nr:hypothetical protein [Clostridia bacterium]